MAIALVDHVADEDDCSRSALERVIFALLSWHARYDVAMPLSALERGVKLHGAILGAIIRDLEAAGRLQVIKNAPWIGIDLLLRESTLRPPHSVELPLIRGQDGAQGGGDGA
jgi:hypothetical protein